MERKFDTPSMQQVLTINVRWNVPMFMVCCVRGASYIIIQGCRLIYVGSLTTAFGRIWLDKGLPGQSSNS